VRRSHGAYYFGMQTTSAELVTIEGVAYNVIDVETPESHEGKGRRNIARVMRASGQSRQVYLRRPTGRVMYYAVQFTRGDWSKVSSMGRWS
jgi:hypothetical protein